MIKEKLEKIGLTAGEGEVYEVLVRLGESSAGKIIKRASLASSKVYDVLHRLITKGLVSFSIKNGVRYYAATPPDRLVDFLENKKEDIDKAKEEVLKLIPKIVQQGKETKGFSNVRMYLGKQGPKIILKELIEESCISGINYGFGTPENPFSKYYLHELNEFFEAEKTDKFMTKLLFARGHKQKQPNAKIRYLKPEFLSPVRTMIAGNKVFMVDFTEPFTSIIIENEQIAKSYKEHFEILWKLAKP